MLRAPRIGANSADPAQAQSTTSAPVKAPVATVQEQAPDHPARIRATPSPRNIMSHATILRTHMAQHYFNIPRKSFISLNKNRPGVCAGRPPPDAIAHIFSPTSFSRGKFIRLSVGDGLLDVILLRGRPSELMLMLQENSLDPRGTFMLMTSLWELTS